MKPGTNQRLPPPTPAADRSGAVGFERALWLALLLHGAAALLLAFGRSGAREPPGVARAFEDTERNAELTTLDLELVTTPRNETSASSFESPSPRHREPSPGSRTMEDDTKRAERAPTPSSGDTKLPHSEAERGGDPGAVATPATSSTVQWAAVSPDSIGLGPTNPFMVSPSADVTDGGTVAGPVAAAIPRGRSVADAKRAVEQSLRQAARERERVLGLGPDGPVQHALADATVASTAPVRGRAVFVARADREGRVVAVDVVATDGHREGWEDAARLTLAGLAGQRVKLPSSADGAEMRIEVSSAWKLPSGQDPGTDVSIFGIPVTKGEGKDSPRLTLLNPIPKLHVMMPDAGPTDDPTRKLPQVGVELELIKWTADPSNIGAKPRRVVHTHLVESTVR